MDLTTAAAVVARVPALAGQESLIGTLITQVSDDIEQEVGRVLEEAAVTEYYDGLGKGVLFFRRGPLVSISSINTVEYDSTGETLTEVESWRWAGRGLRNDSHIGRGWVERVDGSVFPVGTRNVKVIYTAGFDPGDIPDFLGLVAINEVLAEIQNDPGVKSTAIGDYRIEFMDPAKREKARGRALARLMA